MFALVVSVLLVASSAMLLYQFWTRALVIDGISSSEALTDADEPSCKPVLRIDSAA
jgi:hypothetical protein